MNVASVAVPTVTRAPISTSGLAEKVSIRTLDFYYGTSKALKAISLPMSIYENIALGVRLYEKLPRSELDGRVETSLRRAALWEEVQNKLNASGLSLSGGQQQRLCIARTVAVRPEVILFDEPCSALDPISTAKIEELIDELKEDYTIVIVTHNMQQAARVSDFTAFMYLGELIEFDTTSKMFTAPSDRRTQDYITGRFG